MIELPRITVTDANSNYLTSIDSNVDDALHYSSTKLHTYLTGTASTLEFTVTKTTDDFSKIKEGCKLFFIYNEKQYALNVMRIEEDEHTMVITALSLSLELNNKEVDEYKADKQMEIQEYISIFDTQGSLTIGTNELEYRRTLEWEGSSSLLARLLSLATKFDAEIQFTTVIDNLFNITATVIDIYKKNGDGNQGIGQYRPEIKLSYGQNVKTIKRTVDITELQTSIRPIGKDGLTLIGKNYEEYNEDNELEYFSFKESGWIYAPFARDRFPSTTTGKNPDDRFMGATWDYDTDKQDTLYSQALARLKKISEPTVTYEVEGYFDLNLGDTVRIYDDKFNPPLMLEARVSEQEIDFTNPENNKTTFTNFKVLESEIAQSLLDRMNALIAQNKTYNCIIVTDNGNTFKNGKGETTLIARVLDGIKNVTNDFKYQWFKDDVELSTEYMVRIEAKDVPVKAVYRYEATRISDGKIIGGAEITVVNNDDGEQGEPGKDAYTGYLTNEAINITADWEGNVSADDLRSAVGQFILFKGSAILSNVTYSILAQQDMNVTINNEGNYAVTVIDKDYAFARFRAVTKDEDNKEIAIQKTLTVTKSRNGKPGENGKGKDGINAISARLTLPFATVTADPYGTVTQSSLNQIKGNFIVYEGQSEVVTDIEYSVENQFGMSVAIDKLTGAYYVTSINQHLDTATAILKAKYKEIEIKQIFGVSKSKIGKTGTEGILVADTPPTVPTVNQLWQNSGIDNGYVLNRIYRWTGSDWTTHYFYADNIVANTLAAINSQLGTIFAGQMFFSRYNNRWSAYDRLIHGAGMYHDSEQILFYRDEQNYVGLDYKGIKMCTNGTIYYLSYQDNGFSLMPDSLNTSINSYNTGVDLYGKSTYLDLRNQLTEPSADYGGRLWMPDNKYLVELIANISNSPSHVWLTAKNGGSVNLNGESVNVMDEYGINHSPLYASNIGNISSRKVKYSIKELSDVHDDFKALEFKSYRQVSPRSNYQMGIVLEDNIKMPFTDTKSGTIDLYSYATFTAKALQEEIAKRELLEEKVTKLEEKLNDLLQTD